MTYPVQISDGERNAILDRNTNAIPTVSYPHKEIHSGYAFRAGASDLITANAALIVCWKTPAGPKEMHLEGLVVSANSSEVNFYELAVPPTSNGSAVSIWNANRNFPDSDTQTQFMFVGSTLNTTNANTLVHTHVGAVGIKPNDPSFGGVAETRHEWVLRRNTWYAVEVADTSGDDQDMTATLDWYEHAPRTG